MKLYRPAETKYQAKAQRSVMFAGAVICFGACMAIAVLSIDMIRNSHTAAGCIFAVPAVLLLAGGLRFIAARIRYGRDLKRIMKEESEAVQKGEKE